MSLMPLDIIFLVLIAIAVIRCIIKGFIGELFSFLAVVGGILIAFLFNDMAAGILNEMMSPSRWNGVIAFLVVFILVYIIMKVLEGVLKTILDKLNLEKLDKALGLFLGLIEGAIAVLVIIYLMNFIPLDKLHEFMSGSYIVNLVNDLFSWGPGMAAPGFPAAI
ncbi:MAG: CvpA family protein [Spirochaetales bacterium]|nr:CvpA family protein [Spirochaetales bacterium]